MIEVIVFVIFAVASVTGALVMLAARNPVHSAMGLLLTLFSVAVFYVMNAGHFIAAVQVIVYAGAIMTLFLFVIMLIGVDRSEDPTERIPFQRPAVIGLAVGMVGLLIAGGWFAWVPGRPSAAGPPNGTIEALSESLFQSWILPFEVTSLLLIIASVGTIAMAQFRGRKVDM